MTDDKKQRMSDEWLQDAIIIAENSRDMDDPAAGPWPAALLLMYDHRDLRRAHIALRGGVEDAIRYIRVRRPVGDVIQHLRKLLNGAEAKP